MEGEFVRLELLVCLAQGDPVLVTLVPASEFTYGDKYLGAEHSHVSF